MKGSRFLAIFLLLGLAMCLLVPLKQVQAELAVTPWPMFRHDLRHTGRSPYVGPDAPFLKWAFTTGDTVGSSPAIAADGTIYFGSYDRKFYALNPDGTEKWSYATGDAIVSSPAIAADGTIYFGSFDNKLYALSPDGTEKWSYTTGGEVYSSPAISADGTIYFGSYDRKFYALNTDGTEKWSYSTGDFVNPSPAIGADGTIYFGSYDRKLYALNPDGTQKWSYTTGDVIVSSPAIAADGTIYFGSDDGKFYAIAGPIYPLMLEVDVGSVHFAGEKAEFHVMASRLGQRVNATITSARLYGPGEILMVDLTGAVTMVTTGFFSIPYDIPTTASAGTYTLIVDATYSFPLTYGTGLKSFLLSETLTQWNGWLGSIDGNIATIQTDIGTILTNLTNISASIASVDGNIATIQTDIGPIQTSLVSINALITNIDADVATIETEVGTIQINLSSIDTKVTSIEGDMAAVQTALGTISGKVTDIEGGIATIQTDVGTLQADVSHIMADTETTASRSSYLLPILIVAGIGAVAAIVAVIRRTIKAEA